VSLITKSSDNLFLSESVPEIYFHSTTIDVSGRVSGVVTTTSTIVEGVSATGTISIGDENAKIVLSESNSI
jgi:hypothetical protein